jgi:hypothetical protein
LLVGWVVVVAGMVWQWHGGFRFGQAMSRRVVASHPAAIAALA